MGMTKVRNLRPREGTCVDPVQLGDLMARMADQKGFGALGDTLDELALNLARIGPAWRSGRLDQVKANCRRVAAIAVELRFDRLARVARTSVVLTGKGSDEVALAANLARLMRLGEAVLMTIWELQDASV